MDEAMNKLTEGGRGGGTRRMADDEANAEETAWRTADEAANNGRRTARIPLDVVALWRRPLEQCLPNSLGLSDDGLHWACRLRLQLFLWALRLGLFPYEPNEPIEQLSSGSGSAH